MKKLILAGLVIFTTLTTNPCTAVPPKANLLPSDYNTGMSYQEAIKKQKPMVIKFYVDWCGYCRQFAPVFDGIRKEYQDRFNFVLVDCDKPEYSQIVKDYGISMYPTVYIVDPTNNNRIMIPPSFYAEPERLTNELDRFIQIYRK